MDEVVAWLLDGDAAVQYRTRRDLLGRADPTLREAIAAGGDTAVLLSAGNGAGHWGAGFYQPKWICSHYTLLELRNLGVSSHAPRACDVVSMILKQEKASDGGLNPTRTVKASDACVNGMALNYASYFGARADELTSVVDFLLHQQLEDGGFNCRYNRMGARHSSVHSTVCVIEGITQYQTSGYHYRTKKLLTARDEAIEFLLRHHLFRSERTGQVINPEFTRLHHPTRWHFDILRGLKALADSGTRYDPRMADALHVLRLRQDANGRWAANRSYPGLTYLRTPRAGMPHRWLTLTARTVLTAYPEPT